MLEQHRPSIGPTPRYASCLLGRLVITADNLMSFGISAPQSEKAVSAYFTSQQIPTFGFAQQSLHEMLVS